MKHLPNAVGTHSSREPFADRADTFAARWQDAENCQSFPVHHNLAIDQNFVLAVTPMLSAYFDLQLPS